MDKKTTAFVLTKLATGPQSAIDLARNADKTTKAVYRALYQLRQWGWDIQRNCKADGYRDEFYLADPNQIQAIACMHPYDLARKRILAPGSELSLEHGQTGQEVLV